MSDELLILSDVVSSVTSFVSVKGFFLTTTSSLTYGVFLTSPTSSFLTGIVYLLLRKQAPVLVYLHLEALFQWLLPHALMELEPFWFLLWVL